MLKKSNIFKILFLFLFLFPLLNANGLFIIQDNIFINKSYGIDFKIKINVTNEENFKFYNITFNEDIVNLQKFDLESGQSKEVELTIVGNNDFKSSLTLRGEYQTQIGASNKTEIVNINYDTGFDRCNLDLIKGDKVVWVNHVLGGIELINNDNGAKFYDIPEGINKTESFNSPIELNYYARWVGFKFTNVCKINVIDDSGLVHKLSYDDTIDLDLKILYDPTTIQTTFLKTNYEIQYNGEKSDIFKIENTGNKIAKKIHLNSEWIIFDENDFDLASGDSINIGYKIRPLIINTNQTNKTHIKKIEVTGNFNKKEQEISIFIPYKKIEGLSGTGIDDDVIQNFIKSWCTSDLDKCIDLFCTIYPDECEFGFSGSGGNITQEFSSDALKSLIEGYAKLLQESDKREKGTIQTDLAQTNKIDGMAINQSELRKEVKTLNLNVENLITTLVFLVIFVLSIVVIFVLFQLKFNSGFRSLIRSKLRVYRG